MRPHVDVAKNLKFPLAGRENFMVMASPMVFFLKVLKLSVFATILDSERYLICIVQRGLQERAV